MRRVRQPPDISVEILIQAPWKWYFELKTRERVFLLFARTDEELDLWVSGLCRILRIYVKDDSSIERPLYTSSNYEQTEVNAESEESESYIEDKEEAKTIDMVEALGVK